jgi:hypothetical protein
MSLRDIIYFLPNNPILSVVIWIVVLWLAIYLIRNPAHNAIYAFFRMIRNTLRLMAQTILMAEKSLVQRNKEVLLEAGRESIERSIEYEFHRVNSVVKSDLSGYPAFHRALSHQLTQIDEDYQVSAESPMPPPGWVAAVRSIAKLPTKGDNAVADILAKIHKTTISQHKEALSEYREVVAERHRLLKKMVPHWRNLSQTLEKVGKTINGILERSKIIDKKMDDYEAIRAKTDQAQRMLESSSFTQFFISFFVLLIAFGGAVINFNLIALPMSEMVGGDSYIRTFFGDLQTANVAAMVIILVELAMGIYLMESLRITHLFPLIGKMDDKMRVRMIWVTFAILTVLACVESALAFMRDQIAADIQALRQSLADVEAPPYVSSWIPTVGQMVMGFILPFALAFVAIPLESFVHTFRTVLGILIAFLLRSFAFLLRLLGNIFAQTAKIMVIIYDGPIIPLLYLENSMRNRKGQGRVSAKEKSP